MDKNLIFCPALEVELQTSALAKELNFEKVSSKVSPEVKTETSENKLSKNVSSEKLFGLFKFQTKIVWFNAIGFFLMHLAGIYGLYLVVQEILEQNPTTFIWTFFLVFAGGEGITIGAHRLWSHKSFKATKPLQIILIIFQTLAGQNCAYIWIRDHRQHHKYSDTNADPHNANRGFFFSHIGWLMMKKHPDVIRKGKGIDMSDIEANPIIMFQKKYYKPMYVVIAFIIPVFIPMFLWGESFWNSLFINFFFRYIILLNITWSVNSVAHMFGTKPYNKDILPVESYFVSFIGLGEGWHNYHHTFPWDYKASEFGMNLSTTSHIIEFFEQLGWAYDLREAINKSVVRQIKKHGDGSHAYSKCRSLPDLLKLKESEEENLNSLGETFQAENEIFKED